jgi:hypothetical protein
MGMLDTAITVQVTWQANQDLLCNSSYANEQTKQLFGNN